MRVRRAAVSLTAAGLTAAALAAAAFAAAPAAPAGAAAQGLGFASPDGVYFDWIDAAIPAREDFFRHANGAWIKAHPIPPDHAYWGVDSILDQDNQNLIRSLVESLAEPAAHKEWPAGSVQRKVLDFYQSGMDERAIEAAGILPLQGEFARIEAISRAADLQDEFAHLQLIGVPAPMQIGQMQDFKDSGQVIAAAGQGGLGLPNRDYYLRPEPMFQAARAGYQQHVARMFQLLGDAPAAAERESRAVMTLETRLAEASMSEVEQRDPNAIYHPMPLARAASLTPHLDWHALFANLGHPQIASVNIGMPRFFQALDRELSATALAEWKTYLRWHLIDAYAPYLTKAFVEEDFRMTSALTGAQELQARWLRVLRAEDEALGFAIGQLYVAQRFPPAAKQAAVEMVGRIRDALRDDLATLAWMSPATRQAAQQKLALMELRVGYPDRWRDYSGLEIVRGPYAQNVLRANEFEQRRQFAKIGLPVDRTEWAMTPQTVNAYYDASLNSLNIPAGILQPPYFDPGWSDAVNYGAMGAAIGHEMTHGFDDEGARFDGYGNLKDWWAPADSTKFRRATRCIAEQYSQFTVDGGLRVQGELVTGEATADLGGLMLAWRAWRALHPAPASYPAQGAAAEPTPEQLFFLAFAHSWAGAMRAEQLQQLVTTDPHPPGPFRVNATLANSPDFQAAFHVPSASPMVKADRCVIW